MDKPNQRTPLPTKTTMKGIKMVEARAADAAQAKNECAPTDDERKNAIESLEWLDGLKRAIATRVGAPVPRVRTGIAVLDNALGGGLCPGLHLITARPSEGKTALALFACLASAQTDRPRFDERIVYWGLDMDEVEVNARLASCVSMLHSNELCIEPFEYKCALTELGNLAEKLPDELVHNIDAYREGLKDGRVSAETSASIVRTVEGLKKLVDESPAIGGYLKAAKKADELLTGNSDISALEFWKPKDSRRGEVKALLDSDMRYRYATGHIAELGNLIGIKPITYRDHEGKGKIVERNMDEAYGLLHPDSYYNLEEDEERIVGRKPSGDEVELLLIYLYSWADNIRFCVVDYLQRLSVAPGNANGDAAQRTDAVIEMLSSAAQELQIPIIVISDMSKEAARSKTPSMFNASGNSKTAYLPQTVTEITTAKTDNDGIVDMKLNIVKNRQGQKGAVRLRYLPAYNCFIEPDEDEQ